MVKSVSVCLCVCGARMFGWRGAGGGGVMEMRGIIKLSHVQFVRLDEGASFPYVLLQQHILRLTLGANKALLTICK